MGPCYLLSLVIRYGVIKVSVPYLLFAISHVFLSSHFAMVMIKKWIKRKRESRIVKKHQL